MRVLTLSLRHAVSMWKSTLRFVDPMICAISVDVLPRRPGQALDFAIGERDLARPQLGARHLGRREMMTSPECRSRSA